MDRISHEYFVTVWEDVLESYPKLPAEALLEWVERAIKMWTGCRGVLRRIDSPDARALASLCTKFMRLHHRQHALFHEIVVLKQRPEVEFSLEWRKTTRTINCKVDKHKKMMRELDFLGYEVLAITGVTVDL